MLRNYRPKAAFRARDWKCYLPNKLTPLHRTGKSWHNIPVRAIYRSLCLLQTANSPFRAGAGSGQCRLCSISSYLLRTFTQREIAKSLASANADAHIFAPCCDAIYTSYKLQIAVAYFVAPNDDVVAGHFVRQRIRDWKEVFVR
jgi:hypothetical protein